MSSPLNNFLQLSIWFSPSKKGDFIRHPDKKTSNSPARHAILNSCEPRDAQFYNIAFNFYGPRDAQVYNIAFNFYGPRDAQV